MQKNIQQHYANNDIVEVIIKIYKNKVEILIQELKEIIDEGSTYEYRPHKAQKIH